MAIHIAIVAQGAQLRKGDRADEYFFASKSKTINTTEMPRAGVHCFPGFNIMMTLTIFNFHSINENRKMLIGK